MLKYDLPPYMIYDFQRTIQNHTGFLNPFDATGFIAAEKKIKHHLKYFCHFGLLPKNPFFLNLSRFILSQDFCNFD
jgi:hypothetical protein